MAAGDNQRHHDVTSGRRGSEPMFLKIVLAALMAAGLAMSVPMTSATAQTGTTKEDAAKDKAAAKKAKADEKKAKAAERKAKLAEKKAQSKAARQAAQERQKQCGAEWKKARADGKVEKGMTWPKYYSACNKRLKEKTA
jgi:hypothetical protein